MRSVVLAIGVLLLVVSVIAINNNMGLAHDAPTAVAGKLDISYFAFDAMKPIQLNGEWEFAYSAIDHSTIQEYSFINVPSNWANKGHEAFGSAVYRLLIQVPQAGTYALLIDNIYTAYRLYIDGQYQIEIGKISLDQEHSRPRFTDSVITFTTDDTSVEIVFETSNYFHRSAGMLVAPILGHPDDIIRILTSSHIISMILVGIFLATALFILYFYHSTNRDVSLIYFATLCIVLAIRAMAANSLLAILIPNIPTWLVSKLEYATIGISIALLALYSRIAFPKVLPKILEDIMVGISLAYSATVIATPISIYNHLFLPYTVFFGLILAFWIISMTIQFFSCKAVPTTILLGSWVCVLSILIQAFYYFFEIPNLFVINIAPIGVAFFIIAHFHAFSWKFITAFTISKRDSAKLEQEVAQRTDELQQLNAQLSKIARTDALTGLHNHHGLYQMTSKEAKQYNELSQEGLSRYYSVAYIDLDNFKYFNDTYSHKAGDVVLARFAAHLSAATNDSDMVFRAGGDEFIVFLPGHDYETSEDWARSLLSSFNNFSSVIEQTLSDQLGMLVSIPARHALSCSIGIAVHESGMLDIESLIQLADTALYEAKRIGKGCFHLEVLLH